MPLKTPENIETAIEQITRTIQAAAWASTIDILQNMRTRQNYTKLINDAVSGNMKLRKT